MSVAVGGTEGFSARRRETPMRRFLRRFGENRVGVVSVAVLVLICTAVILAPLVAPTDPNATDLNSVRLPPGSPGHLLGTDQVGRDLLSRLIFAGRVSLLAALQAVAIGAVAGIVPAAIAGYQGGWMDWLFMRVADALLSFPPLILAVTVIGIVGPGLTNAMVAVGVIFAPRFGRITRNAVLSVREEEFVDAARSMGLSHWRIVSKHILPHILSPLIVTGTVLAGMAIIIEAGLSFIGLGVQVPQASWGSMLSEAYRFISVAPYQILWPGIAVAMTVLSINFIGDTIQDSIGREGRGS